MGRILALENCRPTSTTTVECTGPLLCHAKPFLKHSCIQYCTKFSRVFKFANFVNFQSFTKMYRHNFLHVSKGFHAPTEKDPVVSIALLTVVNSSGLQYSSAYLINLACMPRPTDAAIISKKCSKIAIYKELDCWKFCTVQYVLAMMGLVSSLSTQYTK